MRKWVALGVLPLLALAGIVAGIALGEGETLATNTATAIATACRGAHNCNTVTATHTVTYAIPTITVTTSGTTTASAPPPPPPPPPPPTGMIYGSGAWAEEAWPPGNWAPYANPVAALSPWNAALPDPSSAVLSPDSLSQITWMDANWAHHFTDWAVSNTPSKDTSSQWGHPLYWAKASDPVYTIRDTGYSCNAGSAASFCPSAAQIPNGAWHATAADGGLAVIQPDGHTEIDFWQVQNANPLSGGGTITVHDFGGLDLNGAGCCGGSSAANQGLAAGAIRGPELAAGAINHALSIVAPCSNGFWVSPATGAGLSGCPSAPPVGARFQLKLSDSQIGALALPAYQKTILRAMARYGLFITDTGGSPMDLQYDPALEYTAFGDSSSTVMSYLASQGYSDPATIAIALPWSDFQIVSSCYAAGSC